MERHHQRRTNFPCDHTATETGMLRLSATRRSVIKRDLLETFQRTLLLERRKGNVTSVTREVILLVIVHTMRHQ